MGRPVHSRIPPSLFLHNNAREASPDILIRIRRPEPLEDLDAGDLPLIALRRPAFLKSILRINYLVEFPISLSWLLLNIHFLWRGRLVDRWLRWWLVRLVGKPIVNWNWIRLNRRLLISAWGLIRHNWPRSLPAIPAGTNMPENLLFRHLRRHWKVLIWRLRGARRLHVPRFRW